MPLFLKEYQERCVKAMDKYFHALAEEKQKFDAVPIEYQADMRDYNKKVWNTISATHEYHSKKTGHGKWCPNFCLKIPTGGGKTLLAMHAIELFQKYIAKRKTGLVLWVVPSEQIFSQTLNALNDRAHPYREKLDQITNGRVIIKTKKDRFSPRDVRDNLVILMMMLQSFSRDKLKKDDLKFFQDSGAFPEFFPAETDKEKQNALYEIFPNLDLESKKSEWTGIQIKTSYGNVVKILEPFIILDEGHKAKTILAESAISECNPACICELTATPHDKSSILFSVAGRELADEEMIKLDLNVIEKNANEWKRVIDYTVEELDKLQKEAFIYLKQTGTYIRPIDLIQVEATGPKTRDGIKIHSEDVLEYLIEKGIPKDQIAIKTSSKNDIEGINLLSDMCPIRFIITKQALQEGWDCPFAYILTTLTGSRSFTALTQIVGRVLRQPYGRKTKIKALDESYVLTFKQSSAKLLSAIKNGFELDGMGDLINRINTPGVIDTNLGERKKQIIRSEVFEKSLSDFFLPAFVVKDSRYKDKIRIIDFNKDILPYIDFDKIDFSDLKDIVLPKLTDKTGITALRFSRGEAIDREDFLEIERINKEIERPLEWKKSFFVRNINDFVPNPWVANDVIENAVKILKNNFKNEDIAAHQIYLLEYIRKVLGGNGEKAGEINRLAKEVFETKLKNDEIRFVIKFDDKILKKDFYFEKENKMAIEKSLFKPEVAKNFNELERTVIYSIDERDKTFWWHRNKPNKDGYFLAAWRKERFYPDFILTLKNGEKDKFEKIYVLETKGAHLLGNLDIKYKKELTAMYNRTIQKIWNKIDMEDYKKIELEFVEEGEWSNIINKIFAKGY